MVERKKRQPKPADNLNDWPHSPALSLFTTRSHQCWSQLRRAAQARSQCFAEQACSALAWSSFRSQEPHLCFLSEQSKPRSHKTYLLVTLPEMCMCAPSPLLINLSGSKTSIIYPRPNCTAGLTVLLRYAQSLRKRHQPSPHLTQDALLFR